MATYLLRRILLVIPTLLGATALIFFVMALAPVSITDVLLSREGNLTPGERAAREAYLNKRYGLDKPPYVQYFKWLNAISPIGAKDVGTGFPSNARAGLKVPDLGNSFKQARSVGPIIMEALPITLLLQAISIPLTFAVAITSGIWAAKHRGKIQDVTIGTLLVGLWSAPVIWIGVLLIGYFANVHYLKWFPAANLHEMGASSMRYLPSSGGRGYLFDTLWHLVLPVTCLTYGSFAFYSKLTRTALLDTLGSDFVRTARAKGLSERVVLYRHALRNSLIPLITVFAHILPALITGSIIVETIFSIPGMGRLVVESLTAQDRELFLTVATFTLLLQLVGYLVSDVLYVVADPRVSYES